MIAKICLVTLLSCVLTQANPVTLEHGPAGSKSVQDNHGVNVLDKTVGAVLDGSGNLVKTVIESVIKGILSAVAEMFALNIEPSQLIAPQIKKMIEDTVADSMRAGLKASVSAVQATRNGLRAGNFLTQATKGVENDPIDLVDDSTEADNFLS